MAQEGSGIPEVTIEPEAQLPKLNVTRVLQSPESTIKTQYPAKAAPEATVVEPHGDYTLVLGAGIKEIQIFDAQGRKIEGLDNNSTTVVDWPEFRKRDQQGTHEYIRLAIDMASIAFDSRRYYRKVDTLPPRLQPFATKYIEERGRGKNECDIPNAAWQLDPAKANETTIKSGDGYILIRQNSGIFVAFQTRSPQGVELPPRNWKRFDNVDQWTAKLPPAISAEFNLLNRPDVVTIDKASNHFVFVYKDRVAFLKPGQNVDQPDFEDKIACVGKNIALDPKNSDIVYYCAADNPLTIMRLNTNGDSQTWHTEAVDLPQQYNEIINLKLDPSGNFFTFESEGHFVILIKDSLKEVANISNVFNGKIDQQGKIRGIDEKGQLVIYDPHFQDAIQEVEKRRVARLAQGLATDLFAPEASTTGAVVNMDEFEHLVPAKTQFETQFDTQIQAIAALEDMGTISGALGKLRTRLQTEGLQPKQIAFITQGIEDAIKGREQILAAPVVAQGLVDLNTKLTAGNLTVAVISEARADLARLKSLEGLVDDATRTQIRALENQVGQQSTELFRTQGSVIEQDVTGLVHGVKAELDQILSMPDFSDWQEFTLPKLIGRLGALANDCPIEASDTQKKILAARRQLQEMSRDYETKFKENYAVVREKASEIMGERVGLMKIDISSLADRIRGRGFTDRSQAESYLRSSESFEALQAEIAQLASQNPEAARELDRELKVRMASVMVEIDRGGLTTIAETGQQMTLFGDTLFPKWEGKVHEKVERQVDVVFVPDDKTKGPGVTADKILGDVGIMEINSRGKLERRRLYEGMQDEDEWRYGSIAYRGEYVFPSYVSQAEYRKIKQEYTDWNRGDASKLRQENNKRRQQLHDLYKEREKPGQREPGSDDQWSARYSELLKDYAEFSASHHILLLNRIDEIRNAPETEYTNGAGYVPEWQSHWTADTTTEQYLEDMANASKMQLELQEGILNLKGHAGTGKDVLVKMFCNRANRPYFAIDCSKWTTEFELSEDVVLEAEDGASKTVKVPSVVLNAITTPGAVMYFNEINAMPEQAQIFLHGLMDEKRTLTLKTSSGKSVRTHESVLLMSSMNPGYPGTFNPQFATKSRMVGLDIAYPSLYAEKDANDPNPNPPISSSEALRVARQIDSLADYTYEANPAHNEFIKLWDRHINGIQNGAPDLSPVQRFDIEAILTLVQFADKLRDGFVLKFEKAKASAIPKGTLLVDQPITGREMRRCAYFLSKMSETEKATANPEAVVRSLLERFFLSHIDKKEDRDEIKRAMTTWTSSKRPAA